MLRKLAVLLSLGFPVFGASQLLSLLPNNAVSNAIQLDSAGNIYVAGYFTATAYTNNQDAFVAKLSADGSKVLFFTVLAGTQSDSADSLAVAADGSVYVAGYTQSSDFPVTAGAYQTIHQGGGLTQGFLAKLSTTGVITYATYINGPSYTSFTGIALDTAGNVFLSGVGGPDQSLTGPYTTFVMKMDPAMSKVLMLVDGYGGGPIQLDSQGNVYLAGTAQPSATFATSGITLTLPSLPSTAFQSTHAAQFCQTFGGSPGGPGGSVSCHYQYVAKLSPTGTLLWATYVTGTYGAIARGMAVDAAGNVIVAGTTNSDDYPVTPGAFQTAYAAAVPPFPVVAGSPYKDPPPETGFVTKVNSTGTALLWSTYFGGSSSDQITGLAVSSAGDIYLSGRATSSDLPAVTAVPDSCRPSTTQALGFVARLSADGAKAAATQVVTGAPDCTYLNCPVSPSYGSYQASWPLAIRANGTAVTAGANGTVASVDFTSTSRIACIIDPADNVQLRSVAPGQLLTILGTDLAPALPFTPTKGVSISTATFGVSFNGTPAPILYSDAQQINVQVPFELAGQTTAQMQVVDQQIPNTLSETHTLAVAARQPTIYLTPAAWESPYPGWLQCGGALTIGVPALALNADGSRNDCTHPATAGTTVTLFVNALGQVTPALATGATAQTPATTLTPGIDAADVNLQPIAGATTTTIPGAISGVAQLQFKIPAVAAATAAYFVTPSVTGAVLRERLVVIWTRAN